MRQEIRVPAEDIARIKANAQAAEKGGMSSIRARGERMDNLASDQMIGQLCEWAASKYLHGHADEYYAKQKWHEDNPYIGDKGYDGESKLGKYDVKGSACANADQIQYLNFLVPNNEWNKWHEMHEEDLIYVAAFTLKAHEPSDWPVWLCGWAWGKDFLTNPPQPRHIPKVHKHPQAKSYVIPMRAKLRLMDELRIGKAADSEKTSHIAAVSCGDWWPFD